MSHQDLGQNLAKKIQEDVGDNGVVESFPRLEGRQMVMMIAPEEEAVIQKRRPRAAFFVFLSP